MPLPEVSTLSAALKHAASSQFFAGGAALGLVGGLVALFRKLPSRLWDLFLRTTTIIIDVESKEIAFEWLQEWMNVQPYSKRTRRLSVSVIRTWDDGKDDYTSRVMFTPAPGNHLFFYKKKLLWFTRNRERGGEKGGEGSSMLPLRETVYIRVFGRSQNVVRDLLAEARMLHEKNSKRPTLYVSNTNYWKSAGPIPARSLESVVMPEGRAEALLADAQTFIDSADWYRDRGIPYRRGYLFWGPPGTGKSSALTALANELGKPLCVCNVGSPTMTDDRLFTLMAEASHGAIMVFEDIDAAVSNRALKGKGKKVDGEIVKPLTLSALLNAIDGVTAREGGITILTTNYIERLDPALVRPGRVDEKIEFGYANRYQARTLFVRFYGTEDGADKFADGIKGKSVAPADIQRLLMNHRNDSKAAIEEFTKAATKTRKNRVA